MNTQNTPVSKLTDEEVLALTNNGALGPSIVGEELYARAAELVKRTDSGRLGPAIVGDGKKKAAAPPARSPDAYEGIPRNVLLKAARAAKLEVKSKAARDELVDALLAAGVAPPEG